VKLRKLVADIAKVEAGMKAKERRKKFDYVNGGHAEWLAKVDGQSLALLTPESVSGWRNSYVAKAGTDPVERKSAERSAATVLRCSRALFSRDVLAMLKVMLPPDPFAGVKLKDPGPQRYHSDVSPEWVLACAERELKAEHSQEFMALLLCLWGGLRRKEADTLTWAQVDFGEAQIHIAGRSISNRRPRRVSARSTCRRGARRAPRVQEGQHIGVRARWRTRQPGGDLRLLPADCTWRRLHAWLKDKGVSQQKAIHALRKESGSLVACAFGIEAARQHLGHGDIRTTSAHYVEKKRRIEVQLPTGEKAGQLRTMEG
jgi:integrase